MDWTDFHIELRDALAGLFGEKAARRIVQDSGIPPQYVDMSGTPMDYWTAIVTEAMKRQKINTLIDVALKEYPDHPSLLAARRGSELPTLTRGPDIDTSVHWDGPTDEDSLEKIIGPENNLLPIAFLEIGSQRARSVCRILVGNSAGSGFLISKDLLVTNHHVLRTADEAGTAKAEFNFQQDVSGLDEQPQSFALKPEAGFWTDKNNDLTIVRVDGDPGLTYGVIDISDAVVGVKDRVSIVQHPGAGPKQVALHNNTIVYSGDERVQYLTDTMPGSSGSPVFDRNWSLVAVHHSGGWLREPESKRLLFRNEGIPVSVLKQGLAASGLMG